MLGEIANALRGNENGNEWETKRLEKNEEDFFMAGNETGANPSTGSPQHVDRLVPMAHVADVDAAARFYAYLGFSIESQYTRPDGVTNFVGLISGGAKLFLALASGPIVPSQQAVLFYMYVRDVSRLRQALLEKGLEDGGLPPGWRKAGSEGHMPERNAVYSISYPFYMPAGELRVQDLDGYTLLIGQLG
ncbi:hypothetical protein VN12_07985 [Pirellula sp. SH-Sr6A]|nr:hypothetical protein VN12_07985 [Pirellula sp. SH-Sr6A]